jgi:ABC-type branched-subunit amino acid transport system substrate-binding protein
LKVHVYSELADSDPSKARVSEFARKFSAKTGREPSTYAAFGYDVMTSLVEAVKKAGDNSEKIRDELEKQSGLQLLNGVLTRSAEEHNGLSPEWLNVRVDPATKKFVQVK